jgi:hypothetical protein
MMDPSVLERTRVYSTPGLEANRDRFSSVGEAYVSISTRLAGYNKPYHSTNRGTNRRALGRSHRGGTRPLKSRGQGRIHRSVRLRHINRYPSIRKE